MIGIFAAERHCRPLTNPCMRQLALEFRFQQAPDLTGGRRGKPSMQGGFLHFKIVPFIFPQAEQERRRLQFLGDVTAARIEVLPSIGET
jgi:hypothetical protein